MGLTTKKGREYCLSLFELHIHTCTYIHACMKRLQLVAILQYCYDTSKLSSFAAFDAAFVLCSVSTAVKTSHSRCNVAISFTRLGALAVQRGVNCACLRASTAASSSMARRKTKKQKAKQKKKCNRSCCGFVWFFLLAAVFFICTAFTWNSYMATNWIDNTQYAPGRCTIDSTAACPTDCQGSTSSGWRCECYVVVSLDASALLLPPAWVLDPANDPLTACYGGVSTYSPLTGQWGQSCGTFTTNNKTAWPGDYLAAGTATGDDVSCFYNTNAEQPHVLLRREFFAGWFALVVVLFCVGLAFVAAFVWCCYLWKCKKCSGGNGGRNSDGKVEPQAGGGGGSGKEAANGGPEGDDDDDDADADDDDADYDADA